MLQNKQLSHSRTISAFVTCVIVGCAMIAVVPPSPSTETDDPTQTERALAEMIRRELQLQPEHEPWEAIYCGGLPALNERVTELFISKKRGYSCLRTRASDMGKVRQDGNRLVLTSIYGDWGPNHCTDTKEFISVPWGERLYLIEGNRVVEFCNAVNAGDEPRNEAHRPFLLRENDWSKKVTGIPSLPKRWSDKYLLKSPINCLVRSVGDYSKDVVVPEYPYTKGKLNGIRITTNAGEKTGLRAGMTLFPQGPAVQCIGYVLSTTHSSSDVLISQYVESESKMKKSLESGIQFSTRKKVQ